LPKLRRHDRADRPPVRPKGEVSDGSQGQAERAAGTGRTDHAVLRALARALIQRTATGETTRTEEPPMKKVAATTTIWLFEWGALPGPALQLGDRYRVSVAAPGIGYFEYEIT